MNELDMTTIGPKIKAWRVLRGLSQYELLAGRYSESYLSKVETSQMRPSDDFVQYIILRLGLTSAKLLQDEKIPSKTKKLVRAAQELGLLNAQIATRTGEYDKAKKLLQQITVEYLPTPLLAEYHFTLGELQLALHEYGQSLANLEQALVLFESDTKISALKLGQVRNCLGLFYYEQNNYVQALYYHKQCLQAIQDDKIQDANFKATIYYNLANEHKAIGEFKLAFDYYSEAAKLAEVNGNLQHKARAFGEMGLVFAAQEDYEQAKMYLYQSAALFETQQQLNLASLLHGILGQTFLQEANLERAESELKNSLEIALQLHNDENMWQAYVNLASLYYRQEKQELAAENAALSITIARKCHHKGWLGQSLAQAAEIKIAQKATEEGLANFDEALEILDDIKDNAQLQQICFRYATALEKLGRAREAMEMYKRAIFYNNFTKN